MTGIRTLHQTACDGVRIAWYAVEDRTPEIFVTRTARSIDGVVRTRPVARGGVALCTTRPYGWNGAQVAKQVAPMIQSFKKVFRSVDGIHVPNMGYQG
ncbi:MAG: hypothetical protein KBD24_03590 [Candidatus Pacebacteria bacterium]|nr:hypothetical protein [Candidatus Paceibacterota bacterium]